LASLYKKFKQLIKQDCIPSGEFREYNQDIAKTIIFRFEFQINDISLQGREI